jgi:hypothetical protein
LGHCLRSDLWTLCRSSVTRTGEQEGIARGALR